jgi:hypothetical protein
MLNVSLPKARLARPRARMTSPGSPALRLYAACIASTVVSAALLYFGKSALDASHQRLARATAEFGQMQQAAAAADQRAMAERRARDVLVRADQLGLAQAGWGQRRLDIRQEPMSRAALNGLLGELRPGSTKLFAPDAFEFSVQTPQEDLFSSPPKQGTLLVITLRGRLLFKTSGAPGPGASDSSLSRS